MEEELMKIRMAQEEFSKAKLRELMHIKQWLSIIAITLSVLLGLVLAKL
jgi:hypothetical protein